LLYREQTDVVFVALYIKYASWATGKAQDAVTEVGISTLDMRDICSIHPSISGVTWISSVRSRHIRISEWRTLFSTATSHGLPLSCAKDFEFGKTESVNETSLKDKLWSAFHIVDNLNGNRGPGPYRKVALVTHGHDNNAEEYLGKVGLSLSQLPTIETIFNTRTIENAVGTVPIERAPALPKVLEHYGLKPLWFHNAGNQATYILVVLILGALSRSSLSRQIFLHTVDGSPIVNADWTLETLKVVIASEVGGRCRNCHIFGHLVPDCVNPPVSERYSRWSQSGPVSKSHAPNNAPSRIPPRRKQQGP
jgi:hypothetical protein